MSAPAVLPKPYRSLPCPAGCEDGTVTCFGRAHSAAVNQPEWTEPCDTCHGEGRLDEWSCRDCDAEHKCSDLMPVLGGKYRDEYRCPACAAIDAIGDGAVLRDLYESMQRLREAIEATATDDVMTRAWHRGRALGIGDALAVNVRDLAQRCGVEVPS